MTKDFTQAMSERTDKQLMDIVTFKRGDYLPEALAAAEKEIEKRKIDSKSFYTDEQIVEMQRTPEELKQTKKFEWYHKVITIFSPIIIMIIVGYFFNKFESLAFLKPLSFFIMIGIYYLINSQLKTSGYQNISEEFKKWIAYTLYIYIGFFLIAIIGVILFGWLH